MSRTLLLTLSPNPSPAQALDRLRRSSEWSAFEAVVRGRIGTEWGLRTGPLHSTQVGRCELQGKRPTMEVTPAIEHTALP